MATQPLRTAQTINSEQHRHMRQMRSSSMNPLFHEAHRISLKAAPDRLERQLELEAALANDTVRQFRIYGRIVYA